MKEDKIRVLLVQPGRFPKRVVIDNTLSGLQQAVGGDIEAVYPWHDEVCLVCDDEGKLKGKPLNRNLEDFDIIAGDFLVCGIGSEDFCSLTDEQVARYEELLHFPKVFMRTPTGIADLPCQPAQYDALMNPQEPKRKHTPHRGDR